ncbi:probable serine/threonine-protein kinase At1g54610 [Typha angustifolia]|uniref:probable serine/threonine-protein kinase At1g54610 n=1 Tax=Typha angustifolia TaxID=59011 RepID=UPI003C2D04CF
MGCACGKPYAIEDSRESPSSRTGAPAASGGSEPVVASVKPTSEAVGVRGDGGGGGILAAERRHGTGSVRVNGGDVERRRERERALFYSHSLRVGVGVPKAMEGEQVAAGWPPWLAAVAPEAILGWVPRRADSFEKLDKIGQGTYSNVYRARDLEKDKIVALKKVRFDNLEPESVKFMAREILILRRLDHPNIIKLEGLVTSRMSCSLYLVFEYMEHDLAGLASFPGLKFTETQVKCYMQQLLRGLDHCHSRGILHRDIKGSNLLIDNSGILKIADFGLASFFDPDQQHPLTSRVVTLWYRPPELLLGATNYGISVDLWSTGCILAELYAGKPIMPGRTEVEQLHKIFKLCGSPSEDYWRKSKLPHATIFKPQHPYRRCVADTFKDFPPPALALMDILLSVDPADRGTAALALKSEFFTTKPLACDPSSLPRYPPSKELDAKRRDEEARRQGAPRSKGQRLDPEKRQRESRAIPAPDANAELASSMQKRQAQPNSRSRSEKFIPHEEVASGFPIEPPRPAPGVGAAEDSQGPSSYRSSHSGPLVHRNQWSRTRRNEGEIPRASGVANLSALAGSVSARRNVSLDDNRSSNEKVGALAETTAHMGRLSESINEHLDATRKYDQILKEDERGSNMDAPAVYGPKGNNIHYSGPLVRPSGDVDQMLKDHDRQIQEVIRRSRFDKSRIRKVQGEGILFGIKPGDFGAAPLYPSSRGTSIPLFPSSRGGLQ